MLSILVFGGSGFIGSKLLQLLLKEKQNIIVYQHHNQILLKNFQTEKITIVHSFSDLFKYKNKISTIYNLASIQTGTNPTYDEYYKGNVESSLKIIQLAKELEIKQYIYVSTTSVFSKNSDMPVLNELSIPNPTNYYGLTKYISEKIMQQEFLNTKIKSSIVRFPSVYGPSSNGGIVETLYKEAIKNKDIEVYGNGEQYRNLLYIESAIDVLYSIFHKRDILSNFEIFLVGSSSSIKLYNIAEKIINLTGSKSKIIPINKFPPSNFDLHLCLDKTKKLLNFKPLSIEEGLKKYIKAIHNENI